MLLNVNEIYVPENPRSDFSNEDFNNLKDSISNNGVLVPIQVIEIGNDGYLFTLVDGERRLRACIELGLNEVPAIALPDDVIFENDVYSHKIIEHMMRTDLSVYDKIIVIKRLKESKSNEEIRKLLGMKESEFNKYLVLTNKELNEFLIERMKDGSINLSEATLLALMENPTDYFVEVNSKWTLRVTYNQLKNQSALRGYVLNDSLPFDFRKVCEGCSNKMQITSLFDENIICISKEGFTKKYTEPIIKIVNELRQDNPNIKISHRNGHKCLEKFGDFPAEYGYSGQNVEEHLGYDKIVLDMEQISKGIYTEDFIKYYQSSDYKNNLDKGEATQPFNIQDGKEVSDKLVNNLIDYDCEIQALRTTIGPKLNDYAENIAKPISEKEIRFLMEETRNEFYIEEFMDENFPDLEEDYLSLLTLGESSEEIAKTILNFDSINRTIRYIIAMELIKYPNRMKASLILGDHIEQEYKEKLKAIQYEKLLLLQNCILAICPLTKNADGKAFWKKKTLKDIVSSLKSENPAYAWNEIAAFINTLDLRKIPYLKKLTKKETALLIAYRLLKEDETDEATQD